MRTCVLLELMGTSDQLLGNHLSTKIRAKTCKNGFNLQMWLAVKEKLPKNFTNILAYGCSSVQSTETGSTVHALCYGFTESVSFSIVTVKFCPYLFSSRL
jgi:hypothetical protein